MITSKPRNDHPLLFPFGADMKFRTMAQTRNYVGDFFEVATAAATGARRMRTDCKADICPDLIHSPGVYFESKAIGKTGSAIVYTHRADNDARFVADGNKLYYWLWNHGTAAATFATLYELRASLAASIKTLLIVEFSMLHAILKTFPHKTLNNKKRTPAGARLGYGSATYKMGWSVRYNTIASALSATYQNARIEVYGYSAIVPTIRAASFSDFDFLHQPALWRG